MLLSFLEKIHMILYLCTISTGTNADNDTKLPNNILVATNVRQLKILKPFQEQKQTVFDIFQCEISLNIYMSMYPLLVLADPQNPPAERGIPHNAVASDQHQVASYMISCLGINIPML
jgi:hypothetical protein